MKPQFGIFLLLSLAALFVYQNCTEARLEPKKTLPRLGEKTIGSSLCSLPPLSSTDKVKLTFIVDLSASNVTPNSPPNEVLGSDYNHQRFEVIRNFLQQSCLQANESTRVAVIGFAHQEILPPGKSCNKNMFVPIDQAGAQIDFLQTTDATTRTHCQTGGGNCANFTTRYDKGIDCAKNVLYNDIDSPDPDNKKSFYMTFFLTDGEPTLNPQVNPYGLTTPGYINMKNTVKMMIRDMRLRASGDALGLTFQPIFYGADYLRRKDPSGNKQIIANNILTEMATEGQTRYILLDNISDLNFCELLVSGTRVPYSFKQVVATNLTARKTQDQILADSDMDGIPDSEESARGFHPQKARSMAPNSLLLDGACGGATANLCSNPEHTTCGRPLAPGGLSEITAFGLTPCEVQRLGLTDGIDSDGDDFVDLMEILKGTPPNDPGWFDDGDSLNEFQEMMLGRDPRFPDDDTPHKWLIDLSRASLSSLEGCPSDQEALKFVLKDVPLVETLPTNSNDEVSSKVPWMHHGRNINVVMVYYILTPQNQGLGGELPDQVYVQYLKMDISGLVIEMSEFKKAGELTEDFQIFDHSTWEIR